VLGRVPEGAGHATTAGVDDLPLNTGQRRNQAAVNPSAQSAATDATATIHGHCHQKALVGMTPTVSVLREAGHEVREVDSGCCGMAGSFGFEKEHYDVSVAIANHRLVPAVEAAPEDARVVASGISCRQQIEHLTGRRALHPVELLWEDVREAEA